MPNREIRFIDSKYNELFRIPDGGSITVKYPDGHKENRVCKYIDDLHAYINGICFHMCEFAELMERFGQTYEPFGGNEFRLENVSNDEFEYMFARRDKAIERGCIGYLRADFDSGKSFHSTWFDETEVLKTEDFKCEFNELIDHLRIKSDTPLLKSRSDMYNVLYAMKPAEYSGDREIRGLKVVTQKHTYYLRCKPRLGEYDLYCYCYNTRLLDKYKNTMLLAQNADSVTLNKFFLGENFVTEIYYNPEANSGGQLVCNEISKDLITLAEKSTRSTDGFFSYIDCLCTQVLVDIDAPEFREYFEDFVKRKADFEGCGEKTMRALKKFSGAEKIKPDKEQQR